MAFKLAEAYVQLSQKGFTQVQSSVTGIHKGLGAMRTQMTAVTAAVGAFAASGAVRVMFDFANAAAESERQTAKLNAVLKATGGISGQTVEGLEAMATQLQNITMFEDDTIKGAQAVLLTFKSIRGDTFRQATEAALDLATVFETDLQSAATMVGKALEDPVRGITALRRVGVSFTKDQEEVIKTLIKTGETAKAQAAILNEIQGQVGGSARAVGETSAGQMAQLRHQLEDLKEEIGAGLLPVVKTLTGSLREWNRMTGGRAAEIKEMGERATGLSRQLMAARNQAEAREIQKQIMQLDKEARALGNDRATATAAGFARSYAMQRRIAELPAGQSVRGPLQAAGSAIWSALRTQGGMFTAEGVVRQFDALKGKADEQKRVLEQIRDKLSPVAVFAE